MLKVLRKFLMGAVAGLGFLAAIATVGIVSAANLSYLTGPQPAADLVSIVNTLIQNINATLAPTGTGTVRSVMGVLGSGTGTTASGTQPLFQFVGANNSFAQGPITTVASGPCLGMATGTNWYINIVDASGTVRTLCVH